MWHRHQRDDQARRRVENVMPFHDYCGLARDRSSGSAGGSREHRGMVVGSGKDGPRAGASKSSPITGNAPAGGVAYQRESRPHVFSCNGYQYWLRPMPGAGQPEDRRHDDQRKYPILGRVAVTTPGPLNVTGRSQFTSGDVSIQVYAQSIAVPSADPPPHPGLLSRMFLPCRDTAAVHHTSWRVPPMHA